MSKGGTTSTTWQAGSTWHSGKTKVIRVPEAIADKVMAYARFIDADIAVLHGNRDDSQDIILGAIAKYIAFKKRNYHANQHSKSLDISTRPWDELRRFRGMVQNQPEKLGLHRSVINNYNQVTQAPDTAKLGN